jgi:2-dehydropantoate 2-reductase
MKIAVMGAGAIGCYFGARLAAAGEEVHFIARGPQLAAMQARGLTVYSPHGNLHLDKVHATNDPTSIGPVDLVLFCLKLWDTDTGAELIKPLLRAETGVYSFQNGIYAEGRLAELLGPQHIIGGYAATPASIVEPGVVRQFGQWCTLGFGEMDNRRTPRVVALLEACQRAKIDSLIEPDIEAALWSKFIFITTHSGATSVCRSTEGPIRSDPWGRQFLAGLASEGEGVARAKGIRIAEHFTEYVMKQIDGLPADAQGSMYTDLQRGARLELEWLNGLMIKIGEEVGVPTPCHRAVMHALHLHAMGNGPKPQAS